MRFICHLLDTVGVEPSAGSDFEVADPDEGFSVRERAGRGKTMARQRRSASSAGSYPMSARPAAKMSPAYAKTCVTVRLAVGYLPSPAPNT
jgi:hypothetical protein